MIDIKQIENYNVADMLGIDIKCTCGKTHKIETEKIVCSEGGINELLPALKKYNAKKIIIATASDIYEKVSKDIIEKVKNEGFEITIHIFSEFFHPTLEKAENLKNRANNFDADCILSIGSGCVTDCSKYVSAKNNIPHVSVATAPSMDGYLSVNSVLIVDNIKNPVHTKAPNTIIFDSNIMQTAPKRMIAAGFGDVASKFISIFDWQIANIFTGEFYCDTIARMTIGAANLAIKGSKQILNGEKEGYTNITEALIRSSVAMQLLDSTRCASGGEHSTAHVIGMYNSANNLKEFMHGEEVILAYWNITKVYKDYFQNRNITVDLNYENIKYLLEKNLKLSENQSIKLVDKLKNYQLPENAQELLDDNRNKFIERIDYINSLIPECKNIYYKLGDTINGMNEDDLSKEQIYSAFSLAPAIKERFVTLSLMTKIK